MLDEQGELCIQKVQAVEQDTADETPSASEEGTATGSGGVQECVKGRGRGGMTDVRGAVSVFPE